MKVVNIGSAVAYSIILVASLVGNTLVGIIVYKVKTMRKTINFSLLAWSCLICCFRFSPFHGL